MCTEGLLIFDFGKEFSENCSAKDQQTLCTNVVCSSKDLTKTTLKEQNFKTSNENHFKEQDLSQLKVLSKKARVQQTEEIKKIIKCSDSVLELGSRGHSGTVSQLTLGRSAVSVILFSGNVSLSLIHI